MGEQHLGLEGGGEAARARVPPVPEADVRAVRGRVVVAGRAHLVRHALVVVPQPVELVRVRHFVLRRRGRGDADVRVFRQHEAVVQHDLLLCDSSESDCMGVR